MNEKTSEFDEFLVPLVKRGQRIQLLESEHEDQLLRDLIDDRVRMAKPIRGRWAESP